ncbi:MAG: glycosyltransferase family 2 protein [Edafosvirus sp.]|uniref:Glycosyltransferase family 2 protein n=1 Tax=Edafosvirus sp. TaxID=2487765 RepID=A0A3G4ZUE2_9VIRU|nr:MAG: glycosyltransferase family 2 protein [Edafosvirus sp.]
MASIAFVDEIATHIIFGNGAQTLELEEEPSIYTTSTTDFTVWGASTGHGSTGNGGSSTGSEQKPKKIYDYFGDWRTYTPYSIVLFYRWSVFILLKVIPSCCYKQLKYKKATPELIEEGNYYTCDDVTVVISVYKPPARFSDTLKSILSHRPKKLTVVSSAEGFERVEEMCSKFPEVTLIKSDKLSKRDKLVSGIKEVKTRLVALTDDDVSWNSPCFLEKLVAPFQHNKKIGGVGCKQVGRIEGFCDWWGIMADMRLGVRFLELMATTRLDSGSPCLSGRTACYRTDLLQREGFDEYLSHEKFFGRILLSGDDKCITRWIINNGFVTYHQLRDNCELATTFETGWAFLSQLKRWSRNSWRSDITSLFVERKIWCITPFTAFILFDKMLSPFFMLYGITYFPYKLYSMGHYELVIGWFCWLLFSRFLKLIYYFTNRQKWKYVIYLTPFVIFQYFQALIRIWTLITIMDRGWGTKNVTVDKNNNIVTNNDVLKSKNYIYDDEKNESKDDQKNESKDDQKKEPKDVDINKPKDIDAKESKKCDVPEDSDNALKNIGLFPDKLPSIKRHTIKFVE